MAAGALIKVKRKAGAFVGGDLAAGELGVDTTNGDLYFSADGSTVTQANGGGGGGGFSNMTESALTSGIHATRNVEVLEVSGLSSNCDLNLVPDGNGSLILGPLTSVNKAATYCLDLQLYRSAATQICTVDYGVNIGAQNTLGTGGGAPEGGVVIGRQNTQTSQYGSGVTIGWGNTTSGQRGMVTLGDSGTNSGDHGTLIGYNGQNTAFGGVQIGGRENINQGYCGAHIAGAYGTNVHGYAFVINGGTSWLYSGRFCRGVVCTNTSWTELTTHYNTVRMTLRTDSAMACIINIVGRLSGGTKHAHFIRQCLIKRNGSVTTIEGSVKTLGSDECPAGWDCLVDADDSNEALRIQCKGEANVRFTATIDFSEVIY